MKKIKIIAVVTTATEQQYVDKFGFLHFSLFSFYSQAFLLVLLFVFDARCFFCLFIPTWNEEVALSDSLFCEKLSIFWGTIYRKT